MKRLPRKGTKTKARGKAGKSASSLKVQTQEADAQAEVGPFESKEAAEEYYQRLVDEDHFFHMLGMLDRLGKAMKKLGG